MGIFDRFRKKKEEIKGSLSNLELLCSDDPEVYEALREVMFLDPRKIEYSLEDAMEKAEKSKDKTNAIFWYRIAGGLAIYRGDVNKVRECYEKLAKLRPDLNLKILKCPEKAVEKAQEYYKKYLKSEKEAAG